MLGVKLGDTGLPGTIFDMLATGNVEKQKLRFSMTQLLFLIRLQYFRVYFRVRKRNKLISISFLLNNGKKK